MRTTLSVLLLSLTLAIGFGQEPAYKIVVKDGNPVVGEILTPIDPQLRIVAQHSNNAYFGLTLNGARITCAPQGSIWPMVRIDGNVTNPTIQGFMPAPKALPPDRTGAARHGFAFTWRAGDLECTQVVEVVPSKPYPPQPAAKRKLDTCRVTYLVENKGTRDHNVAWRTSIDILVNNNDGAAYASPTTHPGQVLNGIELKGKAFPQFLQVLEQPNLANPGMVAVMTLKFGAKTEGPERIVLTNLGQVGAGQWDVVAQAAGDSACAMFWPEKTLKPGQKREMVWAYGGGIASSPDGEGKVSVALDGNLEPGKLFSMQAMVEDPVLGQTLRLELPPGIERVEGAEVEPVGAPQDSGNSVVLWRARVTRPGAFDIKIHSSTGITHVKTVEIQPIGGR